MQGCWNLVLDVWSLGSKETQVLHFKLPQAPAAKLTISVYEP